MERALQQTEHIDLQITGMSCAACATRIEKVVGRIPGVLSVHVNLASEKAHIEVAEGATRSDDVITAVDRAGYGAKLAPSLQEQRRRKSAVYQSDFNEFLISAICTAPLIAQMAVMLFGGPLFAPPWVQWALATPVQFYIGRRFYRGAFHAVRSGGTSMDVLVALGSTIAYAYSVLSILSGGRDVYFDCSATVITTVLLGKLLEAKAKMAANQAVDALSELQTQVAHVKNAHGGETDISVERLQTADIVVVHSGETVPGDGVLLHGTAVIDESLLNGTVLPVERWTGDEIIGGTVNLGDPIAIRITRTGSDTMLAQIIQIVEKAQGSKAAVQRRVDSVTNVFVPVVLALAALTLILQGYLGGWQHAWLPAISVLLVACPCALGLATPTAVMVGAGIGARLGILVKTTESLEKMAEIDTIVFDKTRTLTRGAFRITDVWSTLGAKPQTVLSTAAALEAHSKHPIALAIVNEAVSQGIPVVPVSSVETVPGQGLQGVCEGRSIALGRFHFALPRIVDATVRNRARHFEAQGKSVVLVARDGLALGMIALLDSVKADAAATVQSLKKMRLDVHLVTGDHLQNAQSVAAQVGIDNLMAGALPADKAAFIRKLKENGRTVAMVGDGINDAPALAAADVSIAMAPSGEITFDAADISIMDPDTRKVLTAINLSVATMGKIRQNLLLSLIYNAIVIPVAAFGLFNPMLSGAAMALSSLTVVMNSLLLRRRFTHQRA